MDNNKSAYYKSDAWRVFRIISEFVDGFETLSQVGPSVSIFGSSRLKVGSPEYNLGVEVAQKIAERGFAIVTGGGPGIMEAANRGASTGNGISCGVGIEVPTEKGMNAFVDPNYSLQFRYFFVRKVMFIRYTQACVFLPGGFGTLDELFEALTLVQTEKVKPFPIYLVGTAYWSGLIDWIKQVLLEKGCISIKDLDLIKLTDDPNEIASGIEKHYTLNHTEENF
jgi:hypothetical protein